MRLEALFHPDRLTGAGRDTEPLRVPTDGRQVGEEEPPRRVVISEAPRESDALAGRSSVRVDSADTRTGPGAHRGTPASSAVGRTWQARLDPGRRGALAVVAAVVLAAGVVGWRVVADQPQSRAVPVTAQLSLGSGSAGSSLGSTSAGARAGTSGPAAKLVVVDVIGRVRRPGLVRLPIGSRVDDAVRAAGGVIAGTDLSGLNLARLLTDGEQIAVGIAAAVGSGGSGSGPVTAGGTAVGTGSGAALVNLNTASIEQLDSLPGVGPVLAQRIIDWRTTHGQFDSVDQLTQVTGVGDAKFADLKPLVTV